VSADIANPDRWVDDEHRDLVIAEVRELIPALAFEGFVLTAINGYTQDEAAEILGVTRCHLNKVMRKATRLLQRGGVSYDQWGLN
jgi:DNA-directed RNA polymerase specialized sigma24 family protein